MLKDGERLKGFLKLAKKEVTLCAPFIKVDVLRILLSVISPKVSVHIITRWRPSEVVAGVSDLEVYEVVKNRPNTTISLLDNLHAKLYMADKDFLVGSANLTATALGWAPKSNVELLMPGDRNAPEISYLLECLKSSEPVTYAIWSAVKEAADKLEGKIVLDEAQKIETGTEESRKFDWLPRCAAPERLFSIYQNSNTSIVVEGTREDGVSDLKDLGIPLGLDHDEFTKRVEESLSNIPSFGQIISSLSGKLNDEQGAVIISKMRPDLSPDLCKYQWHIVREWIREFFQNRFEVAPESFVIRIKS